MSNPIKDLLNKYLTNEQKIELKAQIEKFNVAPIQNAAPSTTPAAPTTPDASSQSGKLQDGTEVKWDTPTLSVGSKVTVVTPNGEVPIPDGEYTLDNGSTFEVTNGAVTEVAPGGEVEAPEAVAPEMAAAPVTPNPDPLAPANGTDENPNTESRLVALETAMKQCLDMISKMGNPAQMNQVFSEQIEAVKTDLNNVKEVFNSLLDVSTAAPIEKPITKKIDQKFNNLSKFIK